MSQVPPEYWAPPPPPVPPPSGVAATASLVLGNISVVMALGSCFTGGCLSLVGLPCGIVAIASGYVAIKKGGSLGMAITGIVFGICGLLGSLPMLALLGYLLWGRMQF